MKENKFQAGLIKELKSEFPGCIVLKNDANYIQGFPDLLILHDNRWAALECKRESASHHQPNQDYYIQKLGNMSYASFISPENKKEVFDELHKAFRNSGATRISGS